MKKIFKLLNYLMLVIFVFYVCREMKEILYHSIEISGLCISNSPLDQWSELCKLKSGAFFGQNLNKHYIYIILLEIFPYFFSFIVFIKLFIEKYKKVFSMTYED